MTPSSQQLLKGRFKTLENADNVHLLLVGSSGIVSLLNKSEEALGSSQTFTGTWERNDLPDVMVSCQTDQSGTLYFDFSPDGANVNTFPVAGFPVTAGVHSFHTAVKGPRFFRVRLVNGSGAQTYLRLHVYYGQFRQGNSPLNQAISQDSDAITARVLTEELAMASGLLTGYSIVNKFGRNADVDTGAAEDVWNGGGTYTGFPDSTLETISVLSDSANDASAGTGARTVRIIGLDTDYNVQSETVTLNGTTPVATANTYRRLHTASVQTAGSGGVNAGTLTFRHTTTTANVFLTMVAGLNQTNSAGYTVPAGYTAYMRKLHAAIRGGTNATADGYIWTRPFGSVFRARRPFTVGLSSPLKDEIYGGLVFTEKSDINIRIATVSTNNVDVTAGYDLVLVKN